MTEPNKYKEVKRNFRVFPLEDDWNGEQYGFFFNHEAPTALIVEQKIITVNGKQCLLVFYERVEDANGS